MGNSSSSSLFKSSTPPVSVIHCSADGNRIISIGKKGFDVYEGGVRIGQYQSPFKNVNQCCGLVLESTEEGQTIITGGDDGNVRVFQASTGTFVRNFHEEAPMEDDRDVCGPAVGGRNLFPELSPTSRKPITCLCTVRSENCENILAGSTDGFVRQYDVKSGQEVSSLSAGAPVTCIDFDVVRRVVFLGDSDGRIQSIILDGSLKLRDFSGHTEGVSSLAYCQVSDVLVSCSLDNTVRIWNVDNGNQSSIHTISSQCIHYDPLRDILFIAQNDGSFCISKINSTDKEEESHLEIVKKIQAHKGAVQLLVYSSERDAVVTSSADVKIGFWSKVTDTPHEEAVRNAKKLRVQSLGQDLTEDELVEQINTREHVEASTLSMINEERKVMEMYLELLEGSGQENRKRKDALSSGFTSAVEGLQKALEKISNQFQEQKKEVGRNYEFAFNPAAEQALMEEKIEKKRQELRRKHEQEILDFEARAEDKRRAFLSQIPVMRRQASTQIHALRKRYHQLRKQMEKDVSSSLRKFMVQSFPTINSRYQIGDLVSDFASSVFRGIDLNSLEPVAMKALPAEISLNTSLSHETLVPIIDVCKAEGTNFVVMKLVRENLRDFIEKQPNQMVHPHQAALIVFTLFQSLAYLHSNRVVVRDLRPQNILMDEIERPRLMNIGVMRTLNGAIEDEPMEEGTTFAAPELFCRAVKGSSDIWSLGCVLLQLLQTPEERATKLFYGTDALETLTSMIKIVGKPSSEELEKMAEDCRMDDSGVELLRKLGQVSVKRREPKKALRKLASRATGVAIDLLYILLKFPSHQRISAVEALHHPYFQGFGFTPSFSESEQQPLTDITTSECSEEERREEETNDEMMSDGKMSVGPPPREEEKGSGDEG